MAIRIALGELLAISICAGTAWSQEPGNISDEVQKGHHLAAIICSNCHVAGPDQSIEPILRPPAPSFESIARRSTISADAIRTFLTTTHRDVGNPKGMPNPQLLDFQIEQVTAYLLSLRKPSAAQAGPCRAEIARLELALTHAHANRQVVGSAPESSCLLYTSPSPRDA